MLRRVVIIGWMTVFILLALGCDSSPDLPPPVTTTSPATDVVATREDPRPTILLVVLDTTRADAVSAYGEVEGTTPTVDAIAARGTRFARAYSSSPWTMPSHTTLFSGLRVDEHGVYRIDDGIPLIAEALSDAGYETAAFAENVVLAREFGFDRGFDHYDVTNVRDIMEAESKGDGSMRFFDLARRIETWSAGRETDRPAFVFVNIMDSHGHWLVRDENPWAPEDVTKRELEGVIRRYMRPDVLCRRAPTRADRPLLRGLYLGDVAAADRKLRDVLDALQARFENEPTITIITADHGEHLGEHDLFGHRFSVRTPALHIPLVVAGAPDLTPGAIEAPVDLRAVNASIHCWATGERCDQSLAAPSNEPIVSIWSDKSSTMPEALRAQLEVAAEQSETVDSRVGCDPDEPVYGELVSLIRYPLKVNWAGDRIHSLHDLSWDPDERSDKRAHAGEQGQAIESELMRFIEARILDRDLSEDAGLSEEAARALKALGYIE